MIFQNDFEVIYSIEFNNQEDLLRTDIFAKKELPVSQPVEDDGEQARTGVKEVGPILGASSESRANILASILSGAEVKVALVVLKIVPPTSKLMMSFILRVKLKVYQSTINRVL